jgi:Putative  PD-(D/E)XK family member, (DUF4420)
VAGDAQRQLERTAQTPAVSREYRTKLISTEVPLDILAGIRAGDGAPCLMLQTSPPADGLFELGGMRLSVVPDESGPFLVLSLEDSTRRDMFSTICADVVSATVLAGEADALQEFIARLDAWRRFLRERRSGLSRAEAVGLIGELLVLERVLATDPLALSSWESPNDGLHDFQKNGHALEVKAGIGPSASITISALDQLDTNGLRKLDLLHVRLVENPDGRCLRDIVDDIIDALPDDASRRAFENALLRRGLMPDDDSARLQPSIQQRSMDAYSVSNSFPRLVRSQVPIAIIDATFTLDVRAISAFATETAAAIGEFARGARS